MKFFKLITTALLFLTLQACGGGSSSDDDNGGGSSTLSGTAATGAPIVGLVKVVGSQGNEATIEIDSAGNYSVDVNTLTPPFIIVAIPTDPAVDSQFSFAAAKNITVNITPLTTLAVFQASGNEDLNDLLDGWLNRSNEITQAAIDAQKAIINANFSQQFINAGLDSSAFDIFASAFNADNAGFDGVLDDITFSVDFNNGTFSIDLSGGGFVYDPDINGSGGSGSGDNGFGSLTLSGNGSGDFGLGTFVPDEYVETDVTVGGFRTERFTWTQTDGNLVYELFVTINTNTIVGTSMSIGMSVINTQSNSIKSWVSPSIGTFNVEVKTSEVDFNNTILQKVGAINPSDTNMNLTGTLDR